MYFNELTLFKEYRKNNKQSQQEAGENVFSSSSYSRFEAGELNLTAADMYKILNNLSITPEEFICELSQFSEKKEFDKLFFPPHKEKLIAIYNQLISKEKLTTKDLARYISIKATFGRLWKEIEEINSADIELTYNYLINRKKITTYDFSILRNMVLFFPIEYISKVTYIVFPLKEYQKGIPEISKYAVHFFINVITRRLKEKDIINARKYVNLAKSEVNNLTAIDSLQWIQIQYLEALTNLIEYGDYSETHRINIIIEFLRVTKHEKLATILKNEASEILKGEYISKRNHIID
ncbi:helix-turn-helix domain-containing protein [Enterococcus faecalis]|uniref:helix-turn-helix domain-containing protein n=1 Tax=Enterococcus faecalis TaxID=1351 RepID=UPI0040432155